MITSSYVLTEEERAQLNSIDTPNVERIRLYARDLRVTADAFVVAADAKGLRKDCARYLYNESLRLTRESMAWFERADELENKEV